MQTPNNQLPVTISLDYELFFGSATGSVDKCLIFPIERLCKILDKHAFKLSLFVDACFLIKLRDLSGKYANLNAEYEKIRNQLKRLSEDGHDIQLHVHPHWINSHYDGNSWIIDEKNYRLHDFGKEDQKEIIRRCKEELEAISGNKVFAFRAGGWCIQPFEEIMDALIMNDIWLDSTVYKNGLSNDPIRWFDFRTCEDSVSWKFSTNPTQKDSSGFFTEIPISSIKLSPLFFWKMAFFSVFKQEKLTPYGDGKAMTANKGYYLSRLFSNTYTPASLDGLKATLLDRLITESLKSRAIANEHVNIMGHPKSLTDLSLDELDSCLSKHQSLKSITFMDFLDKGNNV